MDPHVVLLGGGRRQRANRTADARAGAADVESAGEVHEDLTRATGLYSRSRRLNS